jgi:hypothetical protein
MPFVKYKKATGKPIYFEKVPMRAYESVLKEHKLPNLTGLLLMGFSSVFPTSALSSKQM